MKAENFNLKNYRKSGYDPVQNFWNEEDILDFENTFYQLLKMQAYKMRINIPKTDLSLNEKVSNLCIKIDQASALALDAVYHMLRETKAAHNLMCFENIIKIAKKIFDVPTELIKIHMDGILINIPSNSNRLYTWHSESHYYPLRNNFFNTWTPLFNNKKNENGTMVIKEGSQLGKYTFNEFVGYHNKNDNNGPSFHQLDIPEDESKPYNEIIMNYDRNTLVVFDRNTIHRSTLNKSKQCSFAMVIRFYQYCDDVTLSHSHRIKPYSKECINAGYPMLRKYKLEK